MYFSFYASCIKLTVFQKIKRILMSILFLHAPEPHKSHQINEFSTQLTSEIYKASCSFFSFLFILEDSSPITFSGISMAIVLFSLTP